MKSETSVINLASFANKTNVRFKFLFTSDSGNNLYVDNLNIDNIVGIDDIIEKFAVNIMPNPVENESVLSFELDKEQKVCIKVFNVIGKEIATVNDSKLCIGAHSFTLNNQTFAGAGVYFINIQFDTISAITKKLIYTGTK